MKFLINLSVLTILLFTSCSREKLYNWSHSSDKEVKIEKLFEHQKTPKGISIITIADGKRFIYCETTTGAGVGISVTQIIEDADTLRNIK